MQPCYLVRQALCSSILSNVARKLLLIPPSSAAAECNFTAFSIIHTTKRNRLSLKRSTKLVYVYHNLRLLQGMKESVSGVYRTGAEVMKKWKGLKSGAKQRAVKIRKSMSAIGGGDGIEMMENSQQRILGVIGSVCVDGIAGGIDTASQLEIAASCELYHLLLIFVLC